MPPRPDIAIDAARRLWARVAGEATTPEEVAAAAERMCTDLRLGLGRWVGASGYRALLERALGATRAEYPVLGGFSGFGGDEPMITAAVRAQGVGDVAAALVALVAVVTELLGRIVGHEMAARLVELVGTPGPRAVVSPKTEGGHDG